MNDPFLTRDWADRHHDLTRPLRDALARLTKVVRVSVDRQYHYDFDAPWQRRLPRLQRPVRRGRLA